MIRQTAKNLTLDQPGQAVRFGPFLPGDVLSYITFTNVTAGTNCLCSVAPVQNNSATPPQFIAEEIVCNVATGLSYIQVPINHIFDITTGLYVYVLLHLAVFGGATTVGAWLAVSQHSVNLKQTLKSNIPTISGKPVLAIIDPETESRVIHG